MKHFFIVFAVFITIKNYGQTNIEVNYGMDPSVQDFLEIINSYQGPSLQELPLDIGRGAMENLQQDSTITYDSVIFKKEKFTLDDRNVNVVIVKPKKSKGLLPVLVYFHSGGWVFNSFDTHKRLMRDLVLKAEIGVVFVEYSRSPEVKYPEANEEGYFATLYVSKYGKRYGLDSNKIAVGGGSSGGNMATVVSMMAKNRKEPSLLGQLLLYPVTDTNVDTVSYSTFSSGHYLSRDTMIWFWKTYVPDKKLHSLPTVSPLKASIKELENLPPTLLITAEFDVLRDEGEAYAKKLRAAKVSVISNRYAGTIHDFMVLNALKNTESSKAALQQAISFLKDIFNNKRNDF